MNKNLDPKYVLMRTIDTWASTAMSISNILKSSDLSVDDKVNLLKNLIALSVIGLEFYEFAKQENPENKVFYENMESLANGARVNFAKLNESQAPHE